MISRAQRGILEKAAANPKALFTQRSYRPILGLVGRHMCVAVVSSHGIRVVVLERGSRLLELLGLAKLERHLQDRDRDS